MGARLHSLYSRKPLPIIISVLVFVMVFILITIVLNNPALPGSFTEFYLLGIDERADNYPNEVASNHQIQVVVGITNYERTVVRYRIEVRANGLLLTEVDLVTVENGATLNVPLSYNMEKSGNNQRVEFLLFYVDEPTVYRQLQVWTNVR